MTVNSRSLLNNRYQIIDTLGRGGFGESFLAIDTHLPSQKKCVIKQLKPFIQEPTIPRWMCDRFEQEACILESLGDKHQQIPQLYAYFQEGQHFFLVQEWIDGITLTQKVEREGVLSPEQVERILQQLLPVLSYIHSKNIVHRDLKPDNIIYRHQDQCPVLIDFGAVKQALTNVQSDIYKSPYSIAIGTPGYMASEQAAGRPIFSSDLYSLGLTAIYLLTGKTPQCLQTNLKTGEFIWRQELSFLDSSLASVIDRAIRFNPRERFATAEEMLSALSAKNFTIPNHNSLSQDSSSFSQAVTKAIIGGKIPPLSSSDTSKQNQTRDITNRETQKQQEKSFHLPFFVPLLLLPLIGIAGFAFGYQLWNQVNQGNQDSNKTPVAVTEKPVNEDIKNPVETTPRNNNQTTEEQPEDNPVAQTPTASENPPDSSSIPLEDKGVEDKSNSDNSNEQQDMVNIPSIGLSNQEFTKKWGKPSSQDLAYNDRVTIVAYNNPLPRIEQVKYLVSNESKQVVRVDLVVSAKIRPIVMSGLLSQAFNAQITPEVQNAIAEVFTGQTDLRSFHLGDYQGMVQKRNERIEIRVWERDFAF
jgi:serine/threonine-protein kinase